MALDAFLWAFATVRSRSVEVDDDDGGVPTHPLVAAGGQQRRRAPCRPPSRVEEAATRRCSPARQRVQPCVHHRLQDPVPHRRALFPVLDLFNHRSGARSKLARRGEVWELTSRDKYAGGEQACYCRLPTTSSLLPPPYPPPPSPSHTSDDFRLPTPFSLSHHGPPTLHATCPPSHTLPTVPGSHTRPLTTGHRPPTTCEQVFISYGGELDNLHLLLTYGFALADNPHPLLLFGTAELLAGCAMARPELFSPEVVELLAAQLEQAATLVAGRLQP